MERYEEQSLINAIALRVGTAKQLAERFNIPVEELRLFAQENLERIKRAKEVLEGTAEPEPKAASVTPQQLDDLWITNKFERLKRLEAVANETYDAITNSGNLTPAEYTTVVREFRSYLMLAANELGQLLHRGSGDGGAGDTLSVEIGGVDMDSLR